MYISGFEIICQKKWCALKKYNKLVHRYMGVCFFFGKNSIYSVSVLSNESLIAVDGRLLLAIEFLLVFSRTVCFTSKVLSVIPKMSSW